MFNPYRSIMKKLKYSILSLLFISISFEGIANEINEPVKLLLSDFIQKTNALGTETTKEDILDLYSNQYSGNTTYVKLSGAIIKKQYTKKDIASQLNEIISETDYDFKISLGEVIYINQKEKAGTIAALINFESFIDNKIAEKGTMLMNIVGTVSENGWQIIQKSMIRVSETKDIGDCVCHIYDKGDTRFVVQLHYPSGVEYAHQFESFQITTKNDNRIIKSSTKQFLWNKSNNELTYDKQIIGTPKSAKSAIQLLLQNTYREPCADIRFY